MPKVIIFDGHGTLIQWHYAPGGGDPRDPFRTLRERQQHAVAFADPGAGDLDRTGKQRAAKRLVRRLDALGYAVMLRPKPAN